MQYVFNLLLKCLAGLVIIIIIIMIIIGFINFKEGKTLNSSPKTLMTLWPSKLNYKINIDSTTKKYKIYYFQR